jgi:dTMP kinase
VKRGYLLAIEGIDGAGKTTQAAILQAALVQSGHQALVTSEPTDGPFGALIKKFARQGHRAEPNGELRLFMEDRRHHVDQVIAPALESGAVVITDRYYLSTVAYQGARGVDPERILADNEAKFPQPDIAFLLDVPPRIGLERVHSRGGAPIAAFERLDLLEGVAAEFRRIRREYVVLVDAGPPINEVARNLAETVHLRLGLL